MKKNRRRDLLKYLQKETIMPSDLKDISENEIPDDMLRNQWELEHIPNGIDPDIDFDKLWGRLEQKIKAGKEKKQLRLGKTWQFGLRYAAIIFIVVISFLAGSRISWSPEDSSDLITINNPRGRISELRLPDNSKVWINAGSIIQYKKSFTEGDRELWLSGEAYFQVLADKTKPFIVKTANLNVIASGTEFFINAYPDQENIYAGLVQGEITIEAENTGDENRMLLTENQRITYSPSSRSLVRIQETEPDHFSWKAGRLVLDDLSLEEIAFRLENWYDKTIEIDKSIRNQYRFTLTVSDEPLSDILSLLEKAAPILAIQYENGNFKIVGDS
jgi:ferric-dicitrate binding protein FerR (iron transport regulator)